MNKLNIIQYYNKSSSIEINSDNKKVDDVLQFDIDHEREHRTGIPEVVYGMDKNSEQIVNILNDLIDKERNILITRVTKEKADVIKEEHPELIWNPDGQTLRMITHPIKLQKGRCLIISAGTSDNYVVEEAADTMTHFGYTIEKIKDVGVAGIHRVFKHEKSISTADIIIVIAGMEGALPSVIAGITSAPVIGVPTSTGYGVSFDGLTSMYSMLTSCAPGIGVVNIDNGFGAAILAVKILKKIYSKE